MGVTTIYQYQAVFAGSSMSIDSVAVIALTPCRIGSLAFALHNMYAVATCDPALRSTIILWKANSDRGLQAGPSGGVVNVSMPDGHAIRGIYPTVVPAKPQLGTVALLGAVVEDADGARYLTHIDILNMYTWRSAVLPLDVADAIGVLQLPSNAVFLVSDSTAFWALNPSYQLRLCGVDMVSYNGGGCSPVHCRQRGALSNMVRAFGQLEFACRPGYSMVGVVCEICPTGSYCLGGVLDSTKCPSPSTKTLSTGASSSDACVCNPGFYTYPGSGLDNCLQCEKSYWCRGLSYPPVLCWGGGSTLDIQSRSPTQCNCPKNAYGPRCSACPDSSICIAADQRPTSVVSTLVTAWGFDAQGRELQKCSIAEGTVVYDMQPPTITDARNSNPLYRNLVKWQWQLLTPTTAATSWVVANVTACLAGNSMVDILVTEDERVLVTYVVEKPCGLYMEADPTRSYCMCVAGYEQIRTDNGYLICSPCLNATARARWATGGCVLCPSDHRSSADSLGMSACVCNTGFYLSTNGTECIQNPSRWGALVTASNPITAVLIVAGVVAFMLITTGVCACKFL